MFKNSLYLILLAAVQLSFNTSSFAQISTAEYMVTFESTWSAATHPAEFPSNPHFSGLIGATHDTTSSFWAPGALATSGIESMAETGSKSSLTSDINLAIKFGRAETLLSGGGISVSPGSVSLNFEVSSGFPLVTLVSMLAPSPDWFVGVHGLNLYEGNSWVDELAVDLYVYDSGTDSGTNYTSANQDTQPAENIARIEQAPFLINNVVEPVGTFTFRLIASVNLEDATDLPSQLTLSQIYPNPFKDNATLSVGTGNTDYLQIKVFDLLGREVQTIFEGPVLSRSIEGFTFDGSSLPAGRYMVRISGESESLSRLIVRY